MVTPITKIITQPIVFHNRSLTVEGVCRTVCERPFPHFTVEDRSGTIICETNYGLPRIGAHIIVDGQFQVDTPAGVSFPVPRIRETTRSAIPRHKNCTLVGCEFESTEPAIAA